MEPIPYVITMLSFNEGVLALYQINMLDFIDYPWEPLPVGMLEGVDGVWTLGKRGWEKGRENYG